MRQWAKALQDHRCAFSGCQIANGDVMQIVILPNVKSKFFYCREHAQGTPALDVPMLPSEMELYTSNEMVRVEAHRQKMHRIRDIGLPTDFKKAQGGE